MSSPRSIRIDVERCMGSGTCVFHAPNVFAVDPETSLARVKDPAGDPFDQVLDAVDACPTQAIAVELPAAGG